MATGLGKAPPAVPPPVLTKAAQLHPRMGSAYSKAQSVGEPAASVTSPGAVGSPSGDDRLKSVDGLTYQEMLDRCAERWLREDSRFRGPGPGPDPETLERVRSKLTSGGQSSTVRDAGLTRKDDPGSKIFPIKNMNDIPSGAWSTAVSYTHLTLPTPPYV